MSFRKYEEGAVMNLEGFSLGFMNILRSIGLR